MAIETKIKNIMLDEFFDAIIEFNIKYNTKTTWRCLNIDQLSFQHKCDFILNFENKEYAILFKMEYV